MKVRTKTWIKKTQKYNKNIIRIKNKDLFEHILHFVSLYGADISAHRVKKCRITKKTRLVIFIDPRYKKSSS